MCVYIVRICTIHTIQTVMVAIIVLKSQIYCAIICMCKYIKNKSKLDLNISYKYKHFKLNELQ